MTNEDDTADAARVSNWTLATGTKPGAREVYSPPPGSTAARVGPEARSSWELCDASRLKRIVREQWGPFLAPRSNRAMAFNTSVCVARGQP
jgi:hypothetical protein